MSHFKKQARQFLKFLQDASIVVASRRMNQELAQRDAERGRNKFRWFTSEEAAVAEALATLIVPSDETTPGIEDTSVFGPPAIVALDNILTASPYNQSVYSRGLLSFDAWALKERNCKFFEMSKEDQMLFFTAAQHLYESWTSGGSAIMKAARMIRRVTQVRKIYFFAAQLYPQIRDDCLQIFYSSRVSWIWLEYDGPPMDKGYPNLSARD